MMNGAITLGTLDGANVEMHQLVGDDNIYIFGMRSNEVEELWSRGYDSSSYYNNNVRIRRVIDSLKKGYSGVSFDFIAAYLTTNAPIADPYMCMADFASYYETKTVIDREYEDRYLWNKKSLINIAQSGFFAADRAIREYADNIWHLSQVTKK